MIDTAVIALSIKAHAVIDAVMKGRTQRTEWHEGTGQRVGSAPARDDEETIGVVQIVRELDANYIFGRADSLGRIVADADQLWRRGVLSRRQRNAIALYIFELRCRLLRRADALTDDEGGAR